jgi:NADH-quinone oxidoreductase subunit M
MKVVPLILGILFGGAVLSYVLGKIHVIVKNTISFIVLLTSGYLFMTQYGVTDTFSLNIAGFDIIWRINPLSWLFGMMIFGLGLMVLIYSTAFMKGKERIGYFCFSLCITIASMVGIIVSADLLSFFFFWEIMTWSSFLMVIYYRFEAQKAGIKYFVMSAIGAYAMLLALFMIQAEIGSLSFAVIAANWGTFSLGFQTTLILLFLLAFGLKAALMPLHTWAPDAYGISPAPFAALFSGVLSKMGVFGIVILFYVISAGSFATQFITYNGVSLPGYILAWVGVLTALIATIIAVVQDDAKKLLAYSSIGQLGYIVMAIALGDSLGMTSGLFLAVNHTIFKGMLFLAVGAVFYRTGTKKMSELGGLITRMPYTFFVVLLGIITLAGVPPLSGYVGKWMLYEALIQKKMVFLAVVTFAASTIAFLYCYRLIFTIFLGQRPERFDDVKEVPWAMRVPMLLLSLLTIYLGFYPYHLLDVIASAETALFGIEPFVLKDTILFSQIGGINTITVMSIVGAAFVIIFVIFNVVYKRSRLVGLKDIHTSGEVPGPEINLHFAVNFYQPFSRGVQGVLKRSIDRAYQSVAEGLENLFDLMRYIYTGNGQTYAMYVIIFLVFLFVFAAILI